MSNTNNFKNDSNNTEVNSSEELYRKIDEYLKQQKKSRHIHTVQPKINNVIHKKSSLFTRVKQYLELGF